MDFCKAEESIGKLEAAWIRWAKITMALFLIPTGYAAWILIVLLKYDQYGTTAPA
jgi:hypothetical protein